MRISDWSSDVCSSDLERTVILTHAEEGGKTIGRFGASVAPPGDLWHDLRAVSRFGPLAAIPHAVSETWRMSSLRSEERRVGKECVRACRSRGLPDHLKKKNTINHLDIYKNTIQ